MLFSFDMAKGWTSGGSNMSEYEMGIDKGAGQDGKNAATIKSIKKDIKDFGTMMQNCLPDKFIGKRIRMTGYMKSKDVTSWASFWLRVDGKKKQQFLSFDNMHDGKKDRSIKGTTDWAKYEIVLDVPRKASNLAFGALLDGTGQIWFSKLSFEIVDNTVPLTWEPKGNYKPNSEPINLEFEN